MINFNRMMRTKKILTLRTKFFKKIHLITLFGLLLSFVIFIISLLSSHKYSYEINNEPFKEKHFKKLIYVIIDGLRYDGWEETNNKGYYYNNFKIKNDKVNIINCLSITDLPTITSSRTFTLITGARKTLISKLLFFYHNSIEIDNMINQFILNNYKVSISGDDMWYDYLKNLETKVDFLDLIPSYSKHQLFNLEEKCFNRFISKFRNYDASFIHLINLDALGHVYGINNQLIEDVMKVYNRYINQIVDNIDNDTLLIITSDHGVTDQGEHGCSSKKEISSTLSFIYSKEKEVNVFNEFLKNKQNKFNIESDDEFKWMNTKQKELIFVRQNNILNTICYLFGLSIPVNSENTKTVFEQELDFSLIQSNDINLYLYFIAMLLLLIIFVVTFKEINIVHVGIIIESFSYFSFAFRDIVYLLALTYYENNFYLFLFYYTFIEKFKHFEIERISSESHLYIKAFIFVLYIVDSLFDSNNIRFVDYESIIKDIQYIIYYCLSDDAILFLSFISIDYFIMVLLCIHIDYRFLIGILLIRNIIKKFNRVSKINTTIIFFISQIVYSLINLEYNSVCFEIKKFFMLSGDYEIFSALISFLSYIIFPRVVLLKEVKIDLIEFINYLSFLLLCGLISFYNNMNTLVGINFLFDRTIAIYLVSLIDIFILFYINIDIF
ncbi:GPI13 [Hepatospora eriocheir]|uniref:GPI13 n=1 Tax=Hepatospora eriocheir TaxID=1081669 RepID=A0A1X0QE52_9MICR|nr:GPI13 [Hepatospora eriocheir]